MNARKLSLCMMPVLLLLFGTLYAYQRDGIPAPEALPNYQPVQSDVTAEDVPDYGPGSQPDRINLTIVGDPATQIGIQWRTDTRSGPAMAQVAMLSAGPVVSNNLKKWSAVSKVYEHPDYVSVHHHVAIDALKPSTDYLYRVGDGQQWSEWFQFRTASKQQKPFDFLFFGDLQAGIHTGWSRVVRSAWRAHPDAGFMLFAGDIVDEPESDREWHEFFTATGWISGMLPMVATPGNHEYEGSRITPAWNAHFQFPDNGPANREPLVNNSYYFDYQGVRFISINTNTMRGLHMKDMMAQREWLTGLLKGREDEWTVVFHHHPVHAANTKDRSKVQLQWLFAPLYEEYGVDLVLQGDAHTYARGIDEQSSTLGEGPVYIVSNSGVKMDEAQAPWATVSGSHKQLYQHIRVEQDRLIYQSIAADGSVYDEFVLQKQADGSQQHASLDSQRSS